MPKFARVLPSSCVFLLTPLVALTVGCPADDTDGAMPMTGSMTFSMTAATDDGTMPDTGMDEATSSAATDGVLTAGDTLEPGTADDTNDTDGPLTGSGDGPMQGPTCQHQCTVPQDCFIGGEETGLACNMGQCSIACADDMQCIAAASGWTLVDCADDRDCAGGRCIDRGGGVGGCSLQPSQGACSEANLVEMMATALGGGMVTVCGQPHALCSPLGAQNICIVGCAGNPCGGALSCDATDGLCHCEFDTQCVDANAGNNCNPDGLCEYACAVPADCPAAPFDGGMLACQ